MSNYVYISYSQKDTSFASLLTEKLLKSGIHIWYDKMEIRPGENWQKKIEEGLKNASVLLFMASKNSLKSKWTLYEIKNLLENRKQVIPLIIDDFSIDNLPEFLRNIQYVDFRESFDIAFNDLLRAFEPANLLTFSEPSNAATTTKGYVFISYCEEDSDFVSNLKLFLSESGYAYWDYDESNRDYHNLLFMELEDAIMNAEATLSVLSNFWKQSKWAIKEYFFSEEVGTPVFLLRARAIEPTLVIAGIPYIDFTLSSEIGYEKLKKELNRKGL